MKDFTSIQVELHPDGRALFMHWEPTPTGIARRKRYRHGSLRWAQLLQRAYAGQLSDADAALLRSLGRKRRERRSITLVIPSKEQGVSYLYVHRTDGTSRKYKRTRWGDLMVWATMDGLLTTEARLLHSLGRGGS